MKQNTSTATIVTLINPDAYIEFLSGGNWKVNKEDNLVLQWYKQDSLRMDEVNAIWSLILYFASFCKGKGLNCIISTQFRWRVFKLLLKQKFLSSTAFELGMRSFSLLLESKVLDPL